MNKIATTLLTTLAIGTLPLAHAADYDDYARVISATPQTEQINRPRQECRTEYVQVERHVQNTAPNTAPSSNRGNAGAILGGVAGAILGNQVGNGNGRVVATAAGAIAGAMVGDRLENNGSNSNTTNTAHVASNSNYNNNSYVSEQPVRNCRTVDHWETRNNGYTVTYEYQGRTYNTVMTNNPGRRMKVRVSVAPVDAY